VASSALPHWTIQSLATCGTAKVKKNNNNNPKIQINSSYSWRPRRENPGVMGNRVLLGLRKVTAMRQFKADHPLTVKAAKTKIYPKIQRYNIEWFGQEKNRRSYMVLYVLQKVSHRQL
jgi:hypothetical protein